MLKRFNGENGDTYIETKCIEAVYQYNQKYTVVKTTSGTDYLLSDSIDKVVSKIYDLSSI